MSVILVLPRLEIHKANAFASAYSVGFPAMTAWAGFVHTIERQLRLKGHNNLHCEKFGVVSHDIAINRALNANGLSYSLKDQRKPLKADGTPQSMVESATCNLTTSIIIQLHGEFEVGAVIDELQTILRANVKCCSGHIMEFHKPWVKEINSPGEWNWLKKVLMPGYMIVSRQSLLKDAMTESHDALEALIQLTAVHHKCTVTGEGDEQIVTWASQRAHKGWLVPMGVGFSGVSELKAPVHILHSRDNTTPHRFVESLVTLCEFVLCHRIEQLNDALWSTQYDDANQLYFITQN